MRLRSWLVPAAITASTTGVVPFLNGCTTNSGSGIPPDSPITVTATPSPTSTSVTVRWSLPSSGPAPERFLVVALVGNTPIGQVVCTSPACRSIVIPGLTPGDSYSFGVEEGTAGGYSAPGISAPVTVLSGCGTGDVCLSVDATHGGGTQTHPASGLLEGISSSTPASLVAPLSPSFWRVTAAPPMCRPVACTNYSGFDLVAPFKPAVIDILSEAWHNATYQPFQECPNSLLCVAQHAPYPYAGASAPWSDWLLYDAFITQTVRTVDHTGRQVAYWDLINEPPAQTPLNDGYFDANVSNSLTAADLEQWLLHTYRDVKAANPSAKVVCPSLEGYYDYPGEIAPSGTLLDFATFLNFAAANGMKCDAYSWHEINDTGTPTDFNNQPDDIQNHVTRFRALLAQHPTLAGAKIFIDEYGAPTPPGGSGPYDAMPGWNVGYLAALQAAGVDEANRSCAIRADCTDLLDGLLAPDGTTVGPSATYWPYWFYAQMQGQMVPVSSSAEQVSGLAALNPSAKVLYVLAGRHESQDLGGVTTPNQTAPEQISLQVRVPWATSQVTLQSQSYANADGSVSFPTVVATTVPVQNGIATVTVPAVGTDDAFAFTMRPAG